MYYLSDLQRAGFLFIQTDFVSGSRKKYIVTGDLFYSDKSYRAKVQMYSDGRPSRLLSIAGADKDDSVKKILEVDTVMRHCIECDVNGVRAQINKRRWVWFAKVCCMFVCSAGLLKALVWFFTYGVTPLGMISLLVIGVCFFLSIRMHVPA